MATRSFAGLPLRKAVSILLLLLLANVLGQTSGTVLSQGVAQNPAGILFADSFSDGTFSDWTVVDAPGALSGPSSWSVLREKGSRVLRQNANIYTSTNQEGTYASAGSLAWQDYHVNVDLNPDDNDSVFVLFRLTDANNFYRFSMNREQNYRRLEKKVGGVYTTLAEDLSSSYGDGWVNVQIGLRGASIAVSVGYEPVFAVSDNSLDRGRIALGTSASTDCFFDNVIVSGLGIDPYADQVVSAQIIGGENAYPNPIEALGPPRHALDYRFDFVSIGGPGYAMTLDMGEGEAIVDGPGNDLRVYELGMLASGIDEEYNVYVSNAPGGPWRYVGQGLAVTEFDLAVAGVPSARYVRIDDVSRRTDGTETPGSDIDSVQALRMQTDMLLDAPGGVQVTISGGTMRVSWSAVAGAAGYNIYRGSQQYFSQENEELIAGTSYSFSIGSGRNEYVTVTAVSAAGFESPMSVSAPNRVFLPLLRR